MKEPKFRGFSKETNSWYYGHGWFEIDYTDEYLKEKGINQQSMLHTESCPVECELASMGQFTGFKDDNSVEIYEGDYLKTEHGQLGVVYWSHGCYYVKWDEDNYISYLSDCYYDSKVIGNMFEITR